MLRFIQRVAKAGEILTRWKIHKATGKCTIRSTSLLYWAEDQEIIK